MATVGSLTRREFIAQNPHAFLVLHAGLDSLPPASTFATQVLPSPLARALPGQVEVLPIAKKAGNPYLDRVSLGRARNCDIVIRHPTVSKLHARFRVNVGQLTLIPAGSQNGTFRNGNRLDENQVVEVADGDILMFGSVPAKVLDAAQVYELLKAQGGTQLP